MMQKPGRGGGSWAAPGWGGGGGLGLQMAQRQRAASLHLAQREAGVHILHIGQVDQHLARELAEGVEVAAHHLQLKGACAADVVAADDFGNLADRLFQRMQHVAAVAVGVQPHKGQHAQAHFLAVDLGTVAGDEAAFLQRLHAAPAGGCTQAHAVGEFGVAESAIVLQFVQDGEVKSVKCFHKHHYGERFVL